MAAASGSQQTRDKELFIAQQIHFANNLAGNDKKKRAKAVKRIRSYFIARTNGKLNFNQEDFLRFWKGLFYCMWMSDKPLIQEEVAEEISNLIHCFQLEEIALKFIEAHFNTLLMEWYGIDYHRIDKFQMFVRRFLRQCMVFCKKKNWDVSTVSGLCEVFERTILSPSKCDEEYADLSLVLHFVDIFVEELAKIGAKKLPQRVTLVFLKPFCAFMAEFNDENLFIAIREKVFYCLIRQSPEGMEYEEKFEAWKAAGFPGKSWKQMVFEGEKNEEDCSEVDLPYLDPRAGKVDVLIPNIDFDAKSVAELLKEYIVKGCNMERKKQICKLVQNFQALANGNYPLAENISKVVQDSRKYQLSKRTYEDAVNDLLSFNNKLAKKTREERKILKRKNDVSEENLPKPKKKKLNKKSSNDEGEKEKMFSENSQSLELVTSKINNADYFGLDNDNDEIDEIKTDTTKSKILKKKKKKVQGVSKWATSKSLDSTQKKGKEKLLKSGVDPTCLDTGLAHLACEITAQNIEPKESEPKVNIEEVHEDINDIQNDVSPEDKSQGVMNTYEKNLQPPDQVPQESEMNGVSSVNESNITKPEAQFITAPIRKSARKSKMVWKTSAVKESESIQKENSSTFSKTTLTPILRGIRGKKKLSKKCSPTSGQDTPMILDSTAASSKKVNIALQMNQAQAVSEYIASVKQSPSVPHDANKMPCKGVLKRPSLKSPINPFYRPQKASNYNQKSNSF